MKGEKTELHIADDIAADNVLGWMLTWTLRACLVALSAENVSFCRRVQQWSQRCMGTVT